MDGYIIVYIKPANHPDFIGTVPSFDLQYLQKLGCPDFQELQPEIFLLKNYSSISCKSVNRKGTFFTYPNRTYELLGFFDVECSARSICFVLPLPGFLAFNKSGV